MAIDARGLSVRHVRFCRADELAAAEPRLIRQVFDLAGRLVSSFDPRLDRPHTSTIHALSGAALLTDSVDAGWRVSLSGESGQGLETWDSRGSRCSISHDALLRPVRVVEQLEGQAARTVERFTYGDASNESAAHNQCGQLLRRDDPAGSTAFLAFGLTRACLRQQRRFLLELDQPDWPDALSERDAWLEVEGHVSSSVVGPLGDVIESSDAQGHRQLRDFGRDGQLKRVSVKLANAESTQTLVSEIHYNALAAVEQETAGNGVISTALYDEENGRLLRLLAQSPARTFQDLNYTYDPVGNVVIIEDAAQSTEHFSQQRTDPVNRYRYDSLYQLIEATGREVAAFSHGPHLPSFQTLPLDSGCLINYTQRFDYDPGGNLIARHHSGTDTWRMATSTTSNRSVPQRADGSLPDDEQIAAGFDGNGNLIELQPGQIMRWDARNQLSDITSVARDDGPDDGELYRYDGDGQRVRKVRYTQTRSRTLTGDVRYLPGLEIHRNDTTAEVRHVLTVEAGRCTVRMLHWDSGKPNDVTNDPLRYSLSDHLGSSTLELDEAANVISHEGYYPYGGTAWWVGSSAVEAKYKVVRYSGKERDATGLYYYGLRYYAPWLQRWINPDPAGNVDGLNRYEMVDNNPVCYMDPNGLTKDSAVCVPMGGSRRTKQQLVGASTHHFDSYLAPKIMERKERDKASATTALIKRTQSAHANSVGELLERSVGLLAGAKMTFNIRPERIKKLEGESVANIWSLSRNSNTYTEWRDKLENQMFEYAHSEFSLTREAAEGGLTKGKRYSRPVYGALELINDPVTVGGAPNYGQAAFYVPEVSRQYMTMTAVDSLEQDLTIDDLAIKDNLYPLITGMRHGSWEIVESVVSGKPGVRVTEASTYIEWQSHAPLYWRKMEGVKFQDMAALSHITKAPEALRFFERHSLGATVKHYG
jgi:insecticidal toxin complex protein TccC